MTVVEPALKSTVRKPPYSLEAERAVLGALLLDPEAWDKIVGQINELDFHLEAHRKIFVAIEQLAQKDQPFDVLTVSEQLKKKASDHRNWWRGCFI